jgi:ribosomal protein S18 acetylase RimI-like enzyme
MVACQEAIGEIGVMHVVLRPMMDKSFGAYLREHEEEHARGRMISDRESFDQAIRTTRAQHEAMLPRGLLTPGHYFFTLHDERDDRLVGYVWFAITDTNSQLSLYHIAIHKADRRKGYGRATLAAAEEKAKELGCRVIWLNVFGHNSEAIEFYRACGYGVGAMHMNKFLDPT